MRCSSEKNVACSASAESYHLPSNIRTPSHRRSISKKKALAASAAKAKGGWMRGDVLTSRQVRRTRPEKSLGAGQLFSHQLVDGLAVDRLPGQPGHGRLHHPPHVFRRRGAGFLNRRGDRLLNRGGIRGGRQVALEHADLRLFFGRQL